MFVFAIFKSIQIKPQVIDHSLMFKVLRVVNYDDNAGIKNDQWNMDNQIDVVKIQNSLNSFLFSNFLITQTSNF